MKMLISTKFIAGLGLFMAAGFLFGAGAEPSFEATRLRTGRFEYRMMKAGKEMAKFTVTVEKAADGNFRFAGEAVGFNQKWESIATPVFQPVSATLRMQLRDGKMYSMTLKYADGYVTGSEQKESSPANKIDNHVPVRTVDQRIDWAAAMSTALVVGDKFNFTVFDPATGISRVTGEVVGDERIIVPAGTFDTVRIIYQIEKSKGTERYELFATKALPHMMVREDFPNGTSSELVGKK
jgi:Protein of unknown function (DUF3108)